MTDTAPSDLRNDEFAPVARTACIALVSTLLTCVNAAAKDGGLWPQWRGPAATGVAPTGDPPVTWAEGKNVRWKLSLPGVGHSTPVIWGDRIYLTAAIPVAGSTLSSGEHVDGEHDNVSTWPEQDFVVMAIDRTRGAVAWQKTVRRARPHESSHASASWASSSAVTDGERVYAFFGSIGLYALDRAGKPLWQLDFGDLQIKHAHGEGASPALHAGIIVVNWDHEGGSFLVALDGRSGKERWRTPRDEETSWSTPLVVKHAAKAQVVVAASKRVRGYDFNTGALIWQCAGLGGNVVASPVAGDGVVYVANSYDKQAMLAIRLDRAKGEITGTDAIVWSRDRHTPYVPSPLLYRGTLYFFKHYQGNLLAVDAKTGATIFGPERVEGLQNIYASPVAVADHIFMIGLDGTAAVIRHGSKLQVVSTNQLDDEFAASPAIAGDELYLRGRKNLYCIAQDPVADREPPARPEPPAAQNPQPPRTPSRPEPPAAQNPQPPRTPSRQNPQPPRTPSRPKPLEAQNPQPPRNRVWLSYWTPQPVRIAGLPRSKGPAPDRDRRSRSGAEFDVVAQFIAPLM